MDFDYSRRLRSVTVQGEPGPYGFCQTYTLAHWVPVGELRKVLVTSLNFAKIPGPHGEMPSVQVWLDGHLYAEFPFINLVGVFYDVPAAATHHHPRGAA